MAAKIREQAELLAVLAFGKRFEDLGPIDKKLIVQSVVEAEETI